MPPRLSSHPACHGTLLGMAGTRRPSSPHCALRSPRAGWAARGAPSIASGRPSSRGRTKSGTRARRSSSISPYISLYLPISLHISPYLPISPRYARKTLEEPADRAEGCLFAPGGPLAAAAAAAAADPDADSDADAGPGADTAQPAASDEAQQPADEAEAEAEPEAEAEADAAEAGGGTATEAAACPVEVAG